LDWVTRPVFGIVLAAIAIAAIAAGRWYFAAFVGACAIGAAREWHRMVERRALSREFWLSGATITIALVLHTLDPRSAVPWLLLAVGTLLVMLSARARSTNFLWP